MAGCPFSAGRRNLLAGFGAGLGAGLVGLAVPAGAETLPDARAAEEDASTSSIPHLGAHQAGVTTPQPAAGLYAAFDVVGQGEHALLELFARLSRRIAFLATGGDPPRIDPKLPPLDSGTLGPAVVPDNLTVTVAVGASLFDARFGLAARKPRHLVAMQRFPNDALDRAQCHGDILLSFCANTAETNLHALRDIVKNLAGVAAVRWTAQGFLPPDTIKRQGRDTVRNFLGFKDGTANLDSRDTGLMDELVWVQPGQGEPDWAVGGSYQVVRMIRMMVERWDRTPLQEQQTIFGRDKGEGAPLGLAREHDAPSYEPGAQGATVPVDAHIRLANPRTPETEGNRILRRAYNYSRGITTAGQLDMGLLFGCFQSDLQAGFLTVQGRLDGEPLEEYIKPFGGGYFFVLPGMPHPTATLAATLLQT